MSAEPLETLRSAAPSSGKHGQLKRLQPSQSHRHRQTQKERDRYDGGLRNKSFLKSKFRESPSYPRRLSRASSACDTCRQKKVRCNEGRPSCDFCVQHDYRCNYRPPLETAAEIQLAEIIEQLDGIRESIDRISSMTQRHDSIISALLGENGVSIDTEKSLTLQPAAAALLQIKGFDLSSYSSDEPRATSPINVALDQHTARKSISLPASINNSYKTTPYTTLTTICDSTFLVQQFFDKICPLFPIICDLVAMRTVSDVISSGCKNDIETCLIFLLVAIGKESDDCNSSLGNDDFQCALSILTRVEYDFNLQFAQAEMLAGIYLYRKFKVLESWRHIHAGCTTLYVLIERDLVNQIERENSERNTILRLYWISLNLERDITDRFGHLPKTPLSSLQDVLTLPLGCEESNTTHLPMTTRTIYTFFLAETGLKAIIARIRQMSQRNDKETLHRESQYYALDRKSPVTEELECQLLTWLSGIPAFLNWSPKPGQGTQTKNATRLKLLFWFAKISLHHFPVKTALARGESRFTMAGWMILQNTLLATYNLVEVFVLEDLDPDPILWDHAQFAIALLEEAKIMDILQLTHFPKLETLVQQAKDLILITRPNKQ